MPSIRSVVSSQQSLVSKQNKLAFTGFYGNIANQTAWGNQLVREMDECTFLTHAVNDAKKAGIMETTENIHKVAKALYAKIFELGHELKGNKIVDTNVYYADGKIHSSSVRKGSLNGTYLDTEGNIFSNDLGFIGKTRENAFTIKSTYEGNSL